MYFDPKMMGHIAAETDRYAGEKRADAMQEDIRKMKAAEEAKEKKAAREELFGSDSEPSGSESAGDWNSDDTESEEGDEESEEELSEREKERKEEEKKVRRAKRRHEREQMEAGRFVR